MAFPASAYTAFFGGPVGRTSRDASGNWRNERRSKLRLVSRKEYTLGVRAHTASVGGRNRLARKKTVTARTLVLSAKAKAGAILGPVPRCRPDELYFGLCALRDQASGGGSRGIASLARRTELSREAGPHHTMRSRLRIVPPTTILQFRPARLIRGRNTFFESSVSR